MSSNQHIRSYATKVTKAIPFASKEFNTSNLNTIIKPSEFFMTSIPNEPGYCVKALQMKVQQGFLLRRHVLEAISLVKKEQEKKTPETHFVLTGKKGVGKSITLLQMANYYHDQDWIVLYLPRIKSLFSGYEAFQAVLKQPGMFEQPALTSKVLKWILTMNEKILSQVKLTGKPMETLKVATMAELLTKGVENKDIASSTFVQFLDLLQSPNLERPSVFIGMDQLNSLYTLTGYFNTKSERILPDHMVMSKALLGLSKSKLPNGVLFSASDAQHMKRSPLFEQILRHAPIASTTEGHSFLYDVLSEQYEPKSTILPGDQSSQAEDPFHLKSDLIPQTLRQVYVPEMNKEEIRIVLEHYKDNGILFDELNEGYVQMMYTLSNGNPSILLEDTQTYLTPASSKSYMSLKNHN